MWGCTAVSVDNDFTTREAAIALWAANDETTCRVDEEFDVAFDQMCGDDRLDDFFDHAFTNRFE